MVKLLPKEKSESINLDDELLLQYFRLQKRSEGSIKLDNEDGIISPITGAGSSNKNKEKSPLSEIIERFNKRFGTEFTEQDKVLAQIKADLMKDEKIVNSAKSGDKTAFKTLYDRMFNDVLMTRYENNDSFFNSLFNDGEKLKMIKEALLKVLYEEIRNSR